MDTLDTILDIAVDLTAALTTADRYERLLEAVRRVIPFDAATLMRLDGGTLSPVASWGLTEDAMGRQYPLKENPRLEIICRLRKTDAAEAIVRECYALIGDRHDVNQSRGATGI